MSFASFYFLNSEQTMCCPPSIIRKKKKKAQRASHAYVYGPDVWLGLRTWLN
jgi:hypothetical protein